MGTVYLARHVSLNRQVALKTIDPKKARDSQLIGRFQREIAVSAKLQHEHIVHAYDMGQHEGVHFLVLEYVEGADLHSIVKRDGPLSPGEVAAIGLQTASALVYAHAQGVIHRDIKPHNILLSTDGVAKLLDLGLARSSSDNEDEALTSLTQTSMVLGTADYMPPEQAADMKKVDGRSDTYALSATLYFLLTGRPPFPGGNMMSKMHRLANEEPSPIGQLRPDCPRELTAVIETMLAKRPEARYQSTVEVVRALKPLAVDRIAGRPTMTQAVQTAAEADTTIPASKTVAATPFEFSGEGTVAASMLRRRKQPPLGKWLIGGGIAFSVVAVGVALIYSIMSETNSNKRRSSPAVEIPVAAEVSPLAVRDKLPGHYIAKGENTWAWSPNAMYLATGGGDGRVYVWNVETKEPIQCYRAHGSPIVGVVWSNDGTHVVSREERDGEIHIWRTSNGLRRSQLITAEITASQCGMAYAPGKDELAYTNQGAVWRWDIESDRRTLISKDPFIGQGQSSSMNYHLRYSPDANFLAGWNDEGTLNVWNLNAGEQVISLPFEILAPHRDVGFPTDGRIVVVSDNKAQFFNAETGKLVETKPFATDLRPLETSTNSTRVALTQDGRRFLLWVMGRPAILFDLETWKVIASSTATIYETSYVGWTTSQDLRKYAVNLNTSRLWIGETGSNLNWFQVPINVILRFN
jgi:serine/threonine protein kinase